MSETGYVYTLDDPRTDEPRYVGATVKPRSRLTNHATAPHSDALQEWIDELNADGEEPTMTLIRVADADDLRDAEKRLVDNLSERFDLLNAEVHQPYVNQQRSRDVSATGNTSGIQLSRTDEGILRMLCEGRVTVPYVADEIDKSQEYVRSRLTRLVEHGHVERVYRGLYQLTDDPREGENEQ
jgi:tetrahydromethanopterin S-methyltransferase subunit G